MNAPRPASPHDVALRKRQLLAEGQVHRASLVASIQEAKSQVRVEAIARDAGGMLASTLLGMVRGKAARGGGSLGTLLGDFAGKLPGNLAGNWQALLPVAMNALSFVSNKGVLRKLLKLSAVVASTAGVAGVLLRRKKKRAAAPPEHEHDDSEWQ